MSDRYLRMMVGLLAGCAFATALASAEGPAVDKPAWQRLLQGDDAKKAQKLQEQLEALRQAAKFEEALKSAEGLASLRRERQGKDHWEAVNAGFDVEALRRSLLCRKDDQTAYAASFPQRLQADELEQKGRFKDALPLREHILAIDRKVLGEEHPHTALSYDNVAAVLQAGGRTKEAAELYTKALDIRRRVLGEEHPDTAESCNNVAGNLHEQGRDKDAERGFKKALAIFRRVLGEDHHSTAVGYNNLAGLLRNQGRYKEAEDGHTKALAIHRKLYGEEHPSTAQMYTDLAGDLNDQGWHKEAEKNYKKALDIYRKVFGEQHPLIAAGYNNLAYALDDQGRYKDAEEGYKKALDILRKVRGEEHPETATSYNNVASNLNAQGRYKEAEVGYQKALERRRTVLGEEHSQTASSYNNVAVNLNAERRYKEAEAGYQKALEIYRKVRGEDHPLTANCYNNVAQNLYNQGRYTEAKENYDKALSILRKIVGEDNPATVASYQNAAVNLQAQGRYEEAEDGFKKALNYRRKVLGEEHPDTARSFGSLAAVLAARGRYKEAEELYGHAANAFVASRLQIAASGLGRATKTSERSPLLPLAALLARNGKPAAAWERLEQGLGRGTWDDLSARLRRPAKDTVRQTELVQQLERLDQLLAQQSAIRKPTAAQEQERDALLDRRREAQEQLTRFMHYVEDTYGPAAGKTFDRETVQAVLPTDAALVLWIDLVAGLKEADPNGEHWAVMLRARGEPIFERLHGAGPGGAWTEDDGTLPQRLHAALQERRGGWEKLADQLRQQRLQPLSKHLVAADNLPPVHQLVVLPSAALAGVPLEVVDKEHTISYALSGTLYAHLKRQPPVKSTGLLALGDPVFEPTPAAGKERPLPPGGVLLTVVQPGSNAAQSRLRPDDVLLKYADRELKTPADLKAAAAAADPKGDVPVQVWREGTSFERHLRPGALGVVLASKPAREALAERYRLDRVLASRSGDDSWAALPGTRVEVESLRRLFGDKPEPRLLCDSEASEQKLDELAARGELSKYRYVHFATHGEVDNAWPLRSAVILARDTLPDPQQQLLAGKPVYDGRLTAEEMLRTWNLDSELVTLSACQTALGKYEKGEGFVGFAQALVLCGSRSVCLSLWKVDDAATALLMQRFYANLLGKRAGLTTPMPKVAALREAKEWLRGLSREEALRVAAEVSQGVERGKGRPRQKPLPLPEPVPTAKDDKPYSHPYYWAAFVLIGDPD